MKRGVVKKRPPSSVDDSPLRAAHAQDQLAALTQILEAIDARQGAQSLEQILQTVVDSAVRLCHADNGSIFAFEAGFFEELSFTRTRYADQAAYERAREAWNAWRRAADPLPLDRTTLTGRVLLEGRPVRIADIQTEPGYFVRRPPPGLAPNDAEMTRSVLGVPLRRQDEVLGVLVLRRLVVAPFSDEELATVEMLAGPGAIAIQNARLFNETKEALEQQRAVSDVLAAIGRATDDVGPVFRTIIEHAGRLCDADRATLSLREGDRVVIKAGWNIPDAVMDVYVREPLPVDRSSGSGRAILEGRTCTWDDMTLDDEISARMQQTRSATGSRSVMAVPLLRDGVAIGAINLRRTEVRPFTREQAALVETFAEQATIAIENVRLFNDTKEALEQQTATSEVLEEINRSPADVSAVLRTALERAVALCGASTGIVGVVEGDVIRTIATINVDEKIFPVGFKLSLSSHTVVADAMRSGKTVHVPDASQTDYPQMAGRTRLSVPVVKDGKVLGIFGLGHREVRPFTARQIALVETFAAQAAIAIENVRLFTETKEALEQQTASAEILRLISSASFDLQPVFDAVVDRTRRLCSADAAWMNILDRDGSASVFAAVAAPGVELEEFRASYPVGRRIVVADPARPTVMAAAFRGEVVHVDDITNHPEYSGSHVFAGRAGARTVLAVPMRHQDRSLGGIVAVRRAVHPFTDPEVQLARTFADQAAIAIENVRLFNEIQDKSRQLEAASRNKSEFLANMSHELRTPLNAIIGFSEVLLEGMGGQVGDRAREYLRDIRSSGHHLLTLINDVLDLSKVEAGRMELELATVNVGQIVDEATLLVRERGTSHDITIATDIADDLPALEADGRKLKQVVLNLLSNAVKFTPDGGWIGVTARRDGEDLLIAVRDTGVGIAPEDRERIFEEFRQARRRDARAAEGTGLGLALSKRFVELHGGTIAVESEVEKGSTFTVRLPVRQPAPIA